MRIEAAGLIEVPLGCVDIAALCLDSSCDDPQRPVVSRTVDRLVEPTGRGGVTALGLRDEAELEIGSCGPRRDCFGGERLGPRSRRISGVVGGVAVADVDAG